MVDVVEDGDKDLLLGDAVVCVVVVGVRAVVDDLTLRQI
jgi:hypothetical protein